jgi:oxepin-CoA hydrolase/3-oxo-5,6-dehydrosuberyl-CoA semialdehyde dehydrogenase
VHPFRRYFEDLQIGESLLTHRRTVTEADLVNFGCLSGDHFYMHFDEIAAKESQFGKRIAHGYFVLSAAAGLFVSPVPGRCWPTTAWIPCASSTRWASATPSRRA